MISTNLANNILNAFYGRFGSGGTALIPTSNACYLGFSNAAPTFSEAGECTAFPEPAASTGYKRLKAEMDAAAAGSITNGSTNLTWDAPNEGQSFGKATHIGLFSAETGGLPIMVMALTEEVTLGLKNTLILYKGKLTTSLTATDVTTG